MRYILGWGHEQRVGKDTACDFLVEHYGFTKMSFAESLKEECAKLYDWLYVSGTGFLCLKTPVQLRMPGGKKGSTIIHKSVIDRPEFLTDELIQHGMREKHPALLQWWGTDVRRAVNPDYWVNRLEEKLEKVTGNVCISDCRFPNEADMIKRHGGLVIKVNRPDRPIDRDVNHPSEVALADYKNWDFEFNNQSTLDDYLESLDIWAKTWLNGEPING